MNIYLANLIHKIKNIFKNFQLALLVVFWFIFFIVLNFEFVAIKNSLQLVFAKSPEVVSQNSANKVVRINFENYRAVVSRIEKSASFVPSSSEEVNPFRTRE
jgi:hypothetical protein